MSDFLEQQRQEALGADNKWFCSQHHGYEINDPDQLLAYYIKHGGAWHFRQLHLFECELEHHNQSPAPNNASAYQI